MGWVGQQSQRRSSDSFLPSRMIQRRVLGLPHGLLPDGLQISRGTPLLVPQWGKSSETDFFQARFGPATSANGQTTFSWLLSIQKSSGSTLRLVGCLELCQMPPSYLYSLARRKLISATCINSENGNLTRSRWLSFVMDFGWMDATVIRWKLVTAGAVT